MSETPIKFRFDEAKATAAAAWLLKRLKGRMPLISLVKLLYICERKCLERFGRPITGDFFVSMNKGPVLSNVYNLIKGDPYTDSRIWDRHIVRRDADHSVELIADPGCDNLSEAETDVLDGVLAECWDKTKWDLVELTHTFPEWKDPGKSAQPISVEEVLRALNMSEEQIEKIRDGAAEEAQLNQLLGN